MVFGIRTMKVLLMIGLKEFMVKRPRTKSHKSLPTVFHYLTRKSIGMPLEPDDFHCEKDFRMDKISSSELILLWASFSSTETTLCCNPQSKHRDLLFHVSIECF